MQHYDFYGKMQQRKSFTTIANLSIPNIWTFNILWACWGLKKKH